MFKSLRFAPFVLMAASAVELISEVSQEEKLAKNEEVTSQSLSSLLEQVEVTFEEVSIFITILVGVHRRTSSYRKLKRA
jgi:hypothetical protein